VDDGISAGTVGDDVIESVLNTYKELRDGFHGYVSYFDVYSEIGNIPIALIMRAVKWLERNGAALRTVNRMGKGYAFKIRKTGVL